MSIFHRSGIGFGAAAAIGVTIAAAVADRFPGDLEFARAVQDIPGEWFVWLMRRGDELGELLPLAAFAVVAVVALLVQRRESHAMLIAGSSAWYIASPVLKALVERPRPDPALVEVSMASSGFAFPSGHVFAATVVLGSIILLAGSISGGRHRIAVVIRVASAALLADIALSRVFLGVHWPSDVLGAFLIAGLGVALVRWALSRQLATAEARSPTYDAPASRGRFSHRMATRWKNLMQSRKRGV